MEGCGFVGISTLNLLHQLEAHICFSYPDYPICHTSSYNHVIFGENPKTRQTCVAVALMPIGQDMGAGTGRAFTAASDQGLSDQPASVVV